MRQSSSFPALPAVAVLLLATVELNAGDDPVVARVIVPAKQEEIASVSYGGRRCQILALEPASDTPAIIIANSSWWKPAEDAISEELRGALQLMPSLRDEDIRVNGGRGRHVAGAWFPGGWIGTLLHEPFGDATDRTAGVDPEELLGILAERYASRGPVRVFWLDTSLSWLGGSSEFNYQATSIEPYWSLIGDAGLAFWAIIVPPFEPKGSRKTDTWSLRMARNLLGADIRGSRLPHGASLVSAFQDSVQGTVVTVRLHQGKVGYSGLPPKLRVFGRHGRLLLERRFVTTRRGQPVPELPGKLDSSVYRLVDQLEIRAGEVVEVCGNATAPGGQKRFLQLDGITYPGAKPGRPWVALSVIKDVQAKGKLITRAPQNIPFLAEGDSACVGPLEEISVSEVYLYSPEGKWLAVLAIRK